MAENSDNNKGPKTVQFDSESALNELIKREKNLDALELLLQVKLMYISQRRQSFTSYETEAILNQIYNEDMKRILSTLDYGLQINPVDDTKQFKFVLDFTYNLMFAREEHVLMNSLKVLKFALHFCKNHNKLDQFKQFSDDKSFNKHLTSIFERKGEIRNILVTQVLPIYLEISGDDAVEILYFIWGVTLESRNLDTICSLIEFYFPLMSTQSPVLWLVYIKSFWDLLQEILKSDDETSSRKQVLFLLKRAVSSLEGKKHVEIPENIIQWSSSNKEQKLAAYKNLLTILEVSQEKQLHLIEPIYCLLPSLEILHPSWISCVYKTLLNHAHSSVKNYAAISVMTQNWYKETPFFERLVVRLLSVLNSGDTATNTWQEFQTFSSNMNDVNFYFLLEAGSKLNWNPSACFYFYKTLLSQDRPVICSEMDYVKLIEAIVINLEKVPHAYIRNGSKYLLKNYILRTCFSQYFTFNDYIRIIHLFINDFNFRELLEVIDFQMYRTEVKQEIVNWIDNTDVNMNQAHVIIKIIEPPFLPKEWINDYVLVPFQESKFCTKLAYKLCPFLCNCEEESLVIAFLQTRLETLSEEWEVHEMKSVVGFITKTCNNCNDLMQTALHIIQNKDDFKLIQMDAALIVFLGLCERDRLKKEHVTTFKILMEDLKSTYLERKQIYSGSSTIFFDSYCSQIVHRRASADDVSDTCKLFEHFLETQSESTYGNIFMHLKYVIDFFERKDAVWNLVEHCFHKLKAMNRCNYYHSSVDNFLHSLFTNERLIGGDDFVVSKTVIISNELLNFMKHSEEDLNSLAKYLELLSEKNVSVARNFAPVIVELLLLGDVLGKIQRAEYTVCSLINKEYEGELDVQNPNYVRGSRRSHIINILQNIVNSDELNYTEKASHADEFAVLLKEIYSIHMCKRYFANSQILLWKLRIMQALTVIHCHLKQEKQAIIEFLFDCICEEMHQVSVKVFIQWLLIKLLYKEKDCLNLIRTRVDNANRSKPSTIVAFVPILYHIALLRNEEDVFRQVFSLMVPWSMGAHFNLRLSAQEGILNLVRHLKEKHAPLYEEYIAYYNSIENVLKQTQRKRDHIDEMFLNSFHPVENYDLETIYYFLPMITNAPNDEYEYINLRMLTINSTLKSQQTGSQHINFFLEHSLTIEKFTEISMGKTNLKFEGVDYSPIQKKIEVSFQSNQERKLERETIPLIVIASLVDKAPNLGGLSRTCEILGVEELVLPSLSLLKNAEFQALSMSSENWINIKQVKKMDLQKYLLKLKDDDYRVVALEQTSKSVNVNFYEFPKKCALLLGNEKEGIPPNILQMVDACIDIPQFGVIRSLNVHVAGAICIWEYAKQNMCI